MWSGSGWNESGLQLRLMQQLEKDRRRQRGCIGAGCATLAVVLLVLLLALPEACSTATQALAVP
jgi:hypothetical protein